MVYHWNDKQQICYQLYVNEGKSLDEVMRLLKEEYDFAPSKRAFQVTFRRWKFPGKHAPVDRNEDLLARIRQLWEANVGHQETLQTLLDEGYDISERRLMRVRSKHGWLLRAPNGLRSYGSGSGNAKRKRTSEQVEGRDSAGNNAVDNVTVEGRLPNDPARIPDNASPRSDPEAEAKKAERIAQLRTESEQLLAAKKRRRRTRGWAGLPADAPAPPRFPSETTLDESKAFLHLDNERYREIRDQFQAVCHDAGFFKKTEAGPEHWQAAKDKLISGNEHLKKQFYGPFNGVPLESKSLALDVVCTDVTKRMRTLDKGMTIGEAKNILQLNPIQSRKVRSEFYEILRNDNFIGKIVAGNEHWDELKQTWIDNSDILRQSLAAGDTDAGREQRLNAIKVLSRDVMKRFRDDQNRNDPAGKRQIHGGPGPGPAGPVFKKKKSLLKDDALTMSTPPIPEAAAASTSSSARRRQKPQARSQARPSHTQNVSPQNSATQIDPILLAGTDGSSHSVVEQLKDYAATATASSLAAGRDSRTPSGPPYRRLQEPSGSSFPGPIPIWLRASPGSAVQFPVCLAMLSRPSLEELATQAARGRPDVHVVHVWGVVSVGDVTMPIETDEELAAYVEFELARGKDGKVAFVVELSPK